MDHQPPNPLPKTQNPLLFIFPRFFSNKRRTSYYNVLFFFFLLITSLILLTIILTTLYPRYLLHMGSLSEYLQLTHSSPQVCDYSYGKWVWDEDYPSRKYTETCPFLDPGFRCRNSGRRDTGYQKWRWQPASCDLPRFNATDFLDRSRNCRVVFAGDSIVRNQWESMLCMLAQGVSNHSSIYEVNGSPISKHRGFLCMRFEEYNLTVEYYRVPYMVRLDRPPPSSPKEVRGAIRIDKLHWYSEKWVGADVLVVSPSHWWSEDKTLKLGNYFQEGNTVNMTMDVKEAFGRSLNTLMSWANKSLKPEQTRIFYRSYSPVHYRDGTWDGGGHCHTFDSPETNQTKLERDPSNYQQISEAIKKMETAQLKINLVNITYLTELRKDGHPSSHRETGTPPDAPQDCSHWCLPGVPDTWNEVIYAHLLSQRFRTTSS